jgi:hypothetical protein
MSANLIPTPDHGRALELLAGSPDGFTTRVLLIHGIRLELLADLAGAGLVSLQAEPVIGGDRPTEVTRVRITDAGRQALAG